MVAAVSRRPHSPALLSLGQAAGILASFRVWPVNWFLSTEDRPWALGILMEVLSVPSEVGGWVCANIFTDDFRIPLSPA